MKASDLIKILEDFAPLTYQESYDNCGLQVGDANSEVTGILLTLDITEDVVEEALERGCNMIVAHHPVIFGGLKKLTGSNFVQRVVQKAIRHNILLYAAHTNMDNARNGVNKIIADRLGLEQTSILQKKHGTLRKLYTFVPVDAAAKLLQALFAAGAGAIGNYEACSFMTNGIGTFKPGPTANPVIGTAGGSREQVSEVRIEVLVPQHLETSVLRALINNHPYEEVAYDIVSLLNANQDIGSGLIGYLPEPMDPLSFLENLKRTMKVTCIRHTDLPTKPIHKVALCGGSGSFLLNDALRAGADIFITGDYKYHQFFEAEGRIVIADIGHYESEQFTPLLFHRLLTEKNLNFAPVLSNIITNPVNYLF